MRKPDYKKTRAQVNSHMKQAKSHLNRDQKGQCIIELIKTIDILCNSNEEILIYLERFVKKGDPRYETITIASYKEYEDRGR